MDRGGSLWLAVAGAAPRRHPFRSPDVRLNRTARRTGSAQPHTVVHTKNEPLNHTAPGHSGQQQVRTAVSISGALGAPVSQEREPRVRICFGKARFASLFHPPRGAFCRNSFR